MYMIVGLGNPGKEYQGTRHNIGFEVIDKLAFDHSIEVKKVEHKALTGRGSIYGTDCILVKPFTFMNLSGEAVKGIMDYYKIPIKNVIIVYDDVDLELGKIRIRRKGSAGGQKGMRHIINMLKTDEIMRVRVGIDPKPEYFTMSDYVLSKFSKNDRGNLLDGITKATEGIQLILKEGIEEAMNQLNGK